MTSLAAFDAVAGSTVVAGRSDAVGTGGACGVRPMKVCIAGRNGDMIRAGVEEERARRLNDAAVAVMILGYQVVGQGVCEDLASSDALRDLFRDSREAQVGSAANRFGILVFHSLEKLAEIQRLERWLDR